MALDSFVPALDEDGFLGLQSSRTPGHLRWNLGLGVRHAWRSLELGPEGDAAIAHRTMTDLSFQLGLGGRAAVAVMLPMVLHQSGSAVGLPSQALADPWLIGRYRLLGGPTSATGVRRDGPGLALQAGAALPLGADTAFVGESALRSDLRLIGDFHLFGAAIGASVGWMHRFSPQEAFGVPFRDAITFGVALKVPTVVVRDLDAMLELRGSTDAGNPFGSRRTTPLEGNLGLRYRAGDFAMTGLIGGGFSAAYGQPDLRAGLNVVWTPRVRDQDGDGIPDSIDECPMLPEDFDGFEDEDGCPDPDNDNDMIPDEDDLCPNEPALEGWDADEDGCTDPGAPDV